MNDKGAIAFNIVIAVIFFSVLAFIMVTLAYRFYMRRRVYRKTLKQTKMEVPGQAFKMIMSEKSGLMNALEAEIRKLDRASSGDREAIREQIKREVQEDVSASVKDAVGS